MRRADGLGLLAAAGAWCAPGPAAHAPALAEALGIRRRLLEPAGVALTFDDGPDPAGTPAALEMLARESAKATFFLVGEEVRRWPALAAEIAAAGHEVAMHGYVHRSLLLRTPWALEEDLNRALDIIGAATGRSPVWYRAPYGVFSSASLVLARRHRLAPVLWSRWGREWARGATAPEVARRATSGLSAGDIVLLHDAGHYSRPGSLDAMLGALPSVLAAVASLGLSAVALTQST